MAAQVNRYDSRSLVDGDGNFNANIDLGRENRPVAAVSIIGRQSSGKSTLLNRCFSTHFKEMDAKQGMKQTTKGIWIAKWASPKGGLEILIIDTEGSDGAERGGDDRFEKKTALFALAMSDTLIFNMKCDDVNLHHGASRPLLESVLEAMLRKFNTPREVNLVFVLRDKNECPPDTLKDQLIRGIQEIWRGLTQSELQKYFKIEVMLMSHYRREKQEFDKEVGNLRELVMTLVQNENQNGQRFTSASSFVGEAKTIWNDIKKDEILNLQLTKITYADVFCHGIADQKYKNFSGNQSWAQIKGDVEKGNIVEGFGNKVSGIIRNYLSEYDHETVGTHESKRDERRKKLIARMLEDVKRTHLTLVENMRKAKLETFLEALVPEIKKDRLESVNLEKVITEFKNFLEGAKIKEPDWNHADEQLETLKSELVSHEEGARSIVKILKRMKTNDMVRDAMAGLGYAASILTGPLLPVPTGFILPVVNTLSAFIASVDNSKETKQKIKDAKLNPAVRDLWKRLDRE